MAGTNPFQLEILKLRMQGAITYSTSIKLSRPGNLLGDPACAISRLHTPVLKKPGIYQRREQSDPINRRGHCQHNAVTVDPLQSTRH